MSYEHIYIKNVNKLPLRVAEQDVAAQLVRKTNPNLNAFLLSAIDTVYFLDIVNNSLNCSKELVLVP